MLTRMGWDGTGTFSASWSSLPEMWDYLAGECGELTAIVDPIHPPDMPGGKRAPKGSETRLTYSEMRTNVGTIAAALMGLGVQKEVRLQDSLLVIAALLNEFGTSFSKGSLVVPV